MKKLYTFLLLAIAGLISFGASAMEVTFKTNVAGSVTVRDDNYGSYFISDTELTMEVTTGITISPSSDYTIEKVVNKAGETLCAGQRQPYIYFSSFNSEGDEITVTVKEKEVRNLTVYGDASQIYIQDGNYNFHRADDQVDGAWFITKIGDYDYINIHCNDGCAISEVKDNKDNVYVDAITESFQISASKWEGDLTLYVKSVAFADIRDKSFTLKVNGDPSVIGMARKGLGTTFTPSELETVITYRDEELPLSFTHTSWGKKLYAIKVDDKEIAPDGDYFYVTPTDGSTVTIDTNFPDIDVPVIFDLSDEGLLGAISDLRVDDTKITDFTAKGFTAKLGSRVTISFNTNDYNLSEVSIDGTSLSSYQLYNYSFNVTSEKEYVIKMVGTVKQPYTATIICEDYDKIIAYNGYGYGGDPIFELTGKETVVKVPQSSTYITFKAKDTEYYISSVDCEGECENSYNVGQVKVNGDGGIIEVTLTKVVRDSRLVVYVDDADWSTWSSLSFGSYSQPTAFTLTPEVGYSIIKFGDFDNPMQPGFYLNDYFTEVYKYLNGELIGKYEYSVDIKDGDVLKVYAGEPDEHEVKYEIEEGTGLSVFHDHLTAIAEPSTHSVFNNTEIHLVPTATTDEAAAGKLVVKANDTEITPDESGKYVITVTTDTNVKAYTEGQSGVENVAAESDTVNVYTIQGIEVLHNATPEEISQLPAGIYIAAGKKFIVH